MLYIKQYNDVATNNLFSSVPVLVIIPQIKMQVIGANVQIAKYIMTLSAKYAI